MSEHRRTSTMLTRRGIHPDASSCQRPHELRFEVGDHKKSGYRCGCGSCCSFSGFTNIEYLWIAFGTSKDFRYRLRRNVILHQPWKEIRMEDRACMTRDHIKFCHPGIAMYVNIPEDIILKRERFVAFM